MNTNRSIAIFFANAWHRAGNASDPAAVAFQLRESSATDRTRSSDDVSVDSLNFLAVKDEGEDSAGSEILKGQHDYGQPTESFPHVVSGLDALLSPSILHDFGGEARAKSS